MPQHLRLFASARSSAAHSANTLRTAATRVRKAAVALALVLVLAPQLHAQSTDSSRQRALLRHEPLRPQLQGSDGTETGTASFLGNSTTISTPTGALSVFRRPDCSLSLATGTYQIQPFSYTQTELAAN